MVLRRRHPLQHREPAAGFASRLAVVNRRSMGQFLREMGIPPRAIDKGDEEAVRDLASVGGADAGLLLKYTPAFGRQDRNGVVGGETLGTNAVSRTYFRFCPACVQEDLSAFPGPVEGRPWLRLEWTITYFRSCARHRTYFETAAPLRQRFQAFDFAETMATHLHEIDSMVDRAEPAPHSPFQEWVLSRLDGHRDPNLFLDGLPLYAAAEWCEALGVSALHPPKVRTNALTHQDWAQAADEGFRVCQDGEAGILAFLQRLNDAQKRTRGFWGLRDTYGYAYGLLQRTVHDEAFAGLCELVRDFANRTIPIEPGTDVLGQVIDEPGVVSVQTASRVSGSSASTIRTMLNRKGMAKAALDEGLRNHRVTVPAEEIASTLVKLQDALKAPAVEKMFGIPRLHLRAMIAVGALPTLTGSANVPYAKHFLAADDVRDTMRRFFGGAAEVTEPGPRQLPVMDARHAAGGSLEQVLGFLSDGKLAWKGRLAGREDYGALLLDADEITALVRVEPPMVNILRRQIADTIPGMNRFGVDYFVGNGLLVEAMEFSPEARREVAVITRTSAVAFRDRFVTLGELTRVSGLHHKKVRLLLRGVGIAEAYPEDQAGLFVYERARVDAVLASRPDFWQYDKAAALSAAAAGT